MLTLYVDGERWRSHLRGVHAREPRLVPVAKGNGYGLGLHRLARKSAWLGVDLVAVGTYQEVPEVADRFDGGTLVLTPWRPTGQQPVYGDRVVHTVGRLPDLAALAARDDRPRVVLEVLTSMRRHGFGSRELREAADLVAGGGLRVEGVAAHLPLAQGSHLPEMERLMTEVVAAGLATRTLFASHLSAGELDALRTAYPDYDWRPRIGTDLWLGDRRALSVRATVLDVHEVRRGDPYGYRGRRAPRHGRIVVVSGGTAHGVGLESPTGGSSLRDRAATAARGGMDAAGLARSPFTVDGRQRMFAEPPHMQASMLWLPDRAAVPAVGDEVEVRVRYTATRFDATVVS